MSKLKNGISVFVPLYNEEVILEKNVTRLIDFLSNISPAFEIILGSNGSTDKTPEICKKLADTYPEVVFFHIPQRGPGLAFAKAASMAKYSFFICQDADLSVDIQFIAQAVESLKMYDMVIGSKNAGTQKRPLLRLIASEVFILFTNLLLRLPYRDYSIGAKAYRTHEIQPLLRHVDRHTFYTQALVFHLKKANKRIVEIPVYCHDHRQSKFNLFHEGFYRYYKLIQLWLKNVIFPKLGVNKL